MERECPSDMPSGYHIAVHREMKMIYGFRIKSYRCTWQYHVSSIAKSRWTTGFITASLQLVGVVGGNSIMRAFYRLPCATRTTVMNLIYPLHRQQRYVFRIATPAFLIWSLHLSSAATTSTKMQFQLEHKRLYGKGKCLLLIFLTIASPSQSHLLPGHQIARIDLALETSSSSS